jgi:acetylornithine/succinyldiaminopimelate/putrescine aminotransferase
LKDIIKPDHDMLTHRQLFFKHIGQTSPFPLAIEIVKAEGVYMYDTDGKRYIDLVSGVSVSNVGHRHPEVVKAVKEQTDRYMHLCIYGEMIQSPQVRFAELLCSLLPEHLNSVYFVNSGSEAIEGAMKLAKRYTGRHEIISFKNAYHGSTQGSMSLMNDEHLTQAYRPLLPSVNFLDFNANDQLNKITEKTASVVIEVIQGEGGIVVGDDVFIKNLRKRCNDTGSLLIIDEIQTGFGRTGSLFAFEHYSIVPDILVIGKAMGGGMPAGALVSDKTIMDCFTCEPMLGHITTFGGHPVCTAAALASLLVIQREGLVKEAERKGKIYIDRITGHRFVKSIRGKGLFLALQPIPKKSVEMIIRIGLEIGFVSDPFLFDSNAFRIAPPLTITDDEIHESIDLIIRAIESV